MVHAIPSATYVRGAQMNTRMSAAWDGSSGQALTSLFLAGRAKASGAAHTWLAALLTAADVASKEGRAALKRRSNRRSHEIFLKDMISAIRLERL